MLQKMDRLDMDVSRSSSDSAISSCSFYSEHDQETSGEINQCTYSEDSFSFGEDVKLIDDSPVSATRNSGTVKQQDMSQRRAKILDEIFTTEKTYQQHLQLLTKCFEIPLLASCLLPEEDVSTIFGNLHQIRRVNEELLQHLQRMTIGQAFLRLGPFLKLYAMFAYNHQKAITTYMEWEGRSKEFSLFIQRQEARPEVMGLKFQALLITPVQRIPRYKLLLEDLLKCTSASDEDYATLKAAAEEIGEVATHINEHIRQHENFRKMLSIQRSLTGKGVPCLLGPGRVFIREGLLRKVSSRHGHSNLRMFFLFSDILLYAKSRLLENQQQRSYVVCCVIPLQHCRVTSMLGSSALFKISCQEEELLVYAKDADEAKEWIHSLQAAIRELRRNRITLRKESSGKQPMKRADLMRKSRKERRENEILNKTGSLKSPIGAHKKTVSIPDAASCLMSPMRCRSDQQTKSKLVHRPDTRAPLSVTRRNPMADCLLSPTSWLRQQFVDITNTDSPCAKGKKCGPLDGSTDTMVTGSSDNGQQGVVVATSYESDDCGQGEDELLCENSSSGYGMTSTDRLLSMGERMHVVQNEKHSGSVGNEKCYVQNDACHAQNADHSVQSDRRSVQIDKHSLQNDNCSVQIDSCSTLENSSLSSECSQSNLWQDNLRNRHSYLENRETGSEKDFDKMSWNSAVDEQCFLTDRSDPVEERLMLSSENAEETQTDESSLLTEHVGMCDQTAESLTASGKCTKHRNNSKEKGEESTRNMNRFGYKITDLRLPPSTNVIPPGFSNIPSNLCNIQ